MSPFRLQPDEGPGIPWAVLIFLLPVAARVARALLEKLGIVRPVPSEEASTPPPERRRQREVEDEGTDLFERLARGEAPAPPPVERRAPPRPVRTAEVSLESEAEPEPLSVLGAPRDAREPSEVSEPSLEGAVAIANSLESELEPEPLDSLTRPPELSEVAPFSARGFRLLKGDLRRAVLLSEILGPPLSQRAGR